MSDRRFAALVVPLVAVFLVACWLGAFVDPAWFWLALPSGAPIGPLYGYYFAHGN